MNEVLAARIVDSRGQSRVLVLVAAIGVGLLGVMVGGALCFFGSFEMESVGRDPVPTALGGENAANGWSWQFVGIGVMVGAVATAV